MADYREYKRQWRKANYIKVAFQCQRNQARARGILFLLTFEEWWMIWQESGRWDQRGVRKSQYCMARAGDRGPYSIDNVRICTTDENRMEQAANITDETRRRMAVATGSRKSYERTLEIRKKMSVAQKARAPFSEEHRRKISEGQKRRPTISEETRHKLSVAMKARPPRSEEWRRNMSKAWATRPPISDETRRKISETLKARPTISDGTRHKLRAAQQARRAREHAG